MCFQKYFTYLTVVMLPESAEGEVQVSRRSHVSV